MKLLVIMLTVLLAGNALAAELNIYAAASLTDAMQEIAKSYEQQSNDRISFNFGASSLLARQIEEGAPADIFLSADEEKMNALQQQNLILPNTRTDLLGNTLVLIAPDDSTLTLAAPADLVTKATRIAIADPRAVPAGIYAREYLTTLGLWEKLQPKIVPTENVRAALAAVESGNVDAGFVYRTDAKISKKVKIIFSVPAEAGPNIRYPLAIVKETKNKEAAEKFLRYLESGDTRKIFENYGFSVTR